MEKDLEKYFDRLFPICRSITGDGLRKSFGILQEIIPLTLQEVPSGLKCFDWTIPREWNIKDAYIVTPAGKKICKFSSNNLHVVGYSSPVNKSVSYAELIKNLHYIKDLPLAIPYVTSYYKENWGFCISYKEFLTLPKTGKYKVVINSTLKDGGLTYGDVVLPGRSSKEVLFSSYLCHPSMANNELSGPLVMAFLYKKIAAIKNRKYSYRFVLAPETIGIIAYLSKKGFSIKEKLEAGYVITCAGTDGLYTYKRSRLENSLANRAAEHVLRHSDVEQKIVEFDVGGSDERQYCSPGFNMPVGSLMRTAYKEYPEYHTSLDNKSRISFKALSDSVDMYFEIVKALELNACYKSTNPYCEPNLGKRNLYSVKGNKAASIKHLMDLLYVIAQSDGTQDLLSIAEKRNTPIGALREIIELLLKNNLLVLANDPKRTD